MGSWQLGHQPLENLIRTDRQTEFVREHVWMAEKVFETSDPSELIQSDVNVVDFQHGFFCSSSRRILAERAGQKTEAKQTWASVSFPVIFPNFSNTSIWSSEELPHLICMLLSTCTAEEKQGWEYQMALLQGLVCSCFSCWFALNWGLAIRFSTWPIPKWNSYTDSCSLKFAS